VNEEISVPGNFNGTSPLFPLPNVVLFPRLTLPLHIFEPRYRQMTCDALSGDHLIAMALLKPGWEAGYEGKPAIHEVCCLGKVVGDHKLEDGRYNLLLRGISRARIVQELDCGKLYRVARLEILFDTDLTSPAVSRRLRRRLVQLARTWFAGMGVDFQQVSKLFSGDFPLGTVGDVLTFVLPVSPQIKQEALAQLNVERRVERLVEHLAETPPPKPQPKEMPKFPPEFSVN
jgi:Lon protease-like protein